LSHVLHAICAAFDYADIFLFLHPNIVQYSWFWQNFLSSRLDKLYVPHIFAPGCFIAKYIPTLSDHSAFYAVFNAAGFGLRLEPHPRAASFYWKLNSRALSDPAFLPAFRAFWGPVAAQKDTFADCVGLLGTGGQAGHSCFLPVFHKNFGDQGGPYSPFLHQGT
jgi:hypothetical protein